MHQLLPEHAQRRTGHGAIGLRHPRGRFVLLLLFATRNEPQGSSFQERSFTSQSWTPRSRLTRGWTCSACTTRLTSIHSPLGSGVSANPRTRGTANHGQTVCPPLSCLPHWTLTSSTLALDADQQLDLVIVPGERVHGVEYTSRGNGD